jgi:hypothetical protein
VKQELTEAASIAIWNKNKAIAAMALSVWAINIGFLIQGQSAPRPPRAGHPELYVVR